VADSSVIAQPCRAGRWIASAKRALDLAPRFIVG
jgi:hypothetical protein